MYFKKKWTIPGLFLIYFGLFYKQLTQIKFEIFLLISGFDLRISGVGGDRFASCATTTAQKKMYSELSIHIYILKPCLVVIGYLSCCIKYLRHILAPVSAKQDERILPLNQAWWSSRCYRRVWPHRPALVGKAEDLMVVPEHVKHIIANFSRKSVEKKYFLLNRVEGR